jgi:hypothetical protein
MTDLQTIIDEERRASRAQVVANVAGEPVTRGDLSDAFDHVADKSNWKLPVRATIDTRKVSLEMVKEAVVFFTGSVPTFSQLGRDGQPFFQVRAAGYYATCGA